MSAAPGQYGVVDDGVALHHAELRVQIAHVDQQRPAVPLLQRKHQQALAQRRGEEAQYGDVVLAQHLGDVLDELGVGDHEGGHGPKPRALAAGRHGLFPVVHDEPAGRAMQHQPAGILDLQEIGGGVLGGVDGSLVHHALGELHLCFAGANVYIFPGHADVDFADLGIGLQLGGGDGVAHPLDHLARRVPVAILIAIIGNRAGTDDVQPVHAARLRNHRHDFGGSKLNGCNLRFHSCR